MAWRESQTLGRPPSEVYGLGLGTYEGYCFDQAVSYFGQWVEGELDKLDKPSKGARKLMDARKRRLDQILNPVSTPQQFADPAAFFK
ncbi:MAG: hypothetical protein LC687_04960 [Actinobacteria bacterium]|nr:hypothetical protein [Actinomycetota bacterium]